MISMGLSAKQEEDDRFQRIKKEVVDMIKMQAPALESKVFILVVLAITSLLKIGKQTSMRFLLQF